MTTEVVFSFTCNEWATPQIENPYTNGNMPSMLPMLPAGSKS